MTPANLMALAVTHYAAIETAHYGDAAELNAAIDCPEIRTAVCDIWIAETEQKLAIAVEWCNRIPAATI